LDTFSIGGTTALIDWTEYHSGRDRVLPQWANYYVLLFSASTFSGDLYIDDVQPNFA
jgi:hypothetical protein